MSAPGYAVIDFETTGISPLGGDRAVELAIVHLDSDGTITGRWDTLLEPHRDLGLQDTHGLAADDMIGAPAFELLLPRLVELLDGRVIVAHNAAFHLPFLAAEFERAGYKTDPLEALCTMRLGREFIPGAGRTLEGCCAAFDIEVPEERRASADALATATLLGAYLLSGRYSTVWNSVDLASLAPVAGGSDSGEATEWVPRRATGTRAASFLQRITIKMPEFAGPADQLDYLALLDRCLIDRDISRHEANQLVALAEILGISRPTVVELHHQYFEQLTALAWDDDVLTEDEVQDLVAVGTLLSIPSAMVERAMEPFALVPVDPEPVT